MFRTAAAVLQRAQLSDSGHSTHATVVHLSQVAGFVLQKKGAGEKTGGGGDYFCDVGSWLLPEVPPASIRETAALPGEQGHPEGEQGQGPAGTP